MASPPRTRKELFSFIAERLSSNQRLLETTGKPSLSQLKVFWLEINRRYDPKPDLQQGWTQSEPGLFVYADPTGSDHVWLDSSGDRIWYVYTFAPRKKASAILRSSLFGQRGVDHVWLAEPFMERVRREGGYEGRGFGLHFHDDLVADRYLRPKISAKLWLGAEVSKRHEDFVRMAEEVFSKSSLRMGRTAHTAKGPATGLLLELYADGNMTVTTSDDADEIFGLIHEVGDVYSNELEEMEERRRQSPRPVELVFGKELKLDRFAGLVEAGSGGAKLWLHKYGTEDGLDRYSGTDLHTRELINLDVAQGYAYVVPERDGCMNAAPRLMTLTARLMSGKTELYYEGDRLFA